MLHSTPSDGGHGSPEWPAETLPDGLLDRLRAGTPVVSRPVEVARARALLASGAWFGTDVAEAIAATLLTGDDVS